MHETKPPHTLNEQPKYKKKYAQYILQSSEINTITLNPYGIYTSSHYWYYIKNSVVAAFMYQNECAINIFFFKTTKTNNQLPKIQSKQKQIFSVVKEKERIWIYYYSSRGRSTLTSKWKFNIFLRWLFLCAGEIFA